MISVQVCQRVPGLKNPVMNLKGVAVEKDKKANTISICATYEMPEVKGELEIRLSHHA